MEETKVGGEGKDKGMLRIVFRSSIQLYKINVGESADINLQLHNITDDKLSIYYFNQPTIL